MWMYCVYRCLGSLLFSSTKTSQLFFPTETSARPYLLQPREMKSSTPRSRVLLAPFIVRFSTQRRSRQNTNLIFQKQKEFSMMRGGKLKKKAVFAPKRAKA